MPIGGNLPRFEAGNLIGREGSRGRQGELLIGSWKMGVALDCGCTCTPSNKKGSKVNLDLATQPFRESDVIQHGGQKSRGLGWTRTSTRNRFVYIWEEKDHPDLMVQKNMDACACLAREKRGHFVTLTWRIEKRGHFVTLTWRMRIGLWLGWETADQSGKRIAGSDQKNTTQDMPWNVLSVGGTSAIWWRNLFSEKRRSPRFSAFGQWATQGLDHLEIPKRVPFLKLFNVRLLRTSLFCCFEKRQLLTWKKKYRPLKNIYQDKLRARY